MAVNVRVDAIPASRHTCYFPKVGIAEYNTPNTSVGKSPASQSSIPI